MTDAKEALQFHAVLTIAPEFVLIPVENGYLLDGGRHQKIFTGSAVLSAWPSMVPLIDGNRSLADIAAALPKLARNDIEGGALELLASGAVRLGESSKEKEVSSRATNTHSLLRRSMMKTGVESAFRVLDMTKIVVLHDDFSLETAKEIVQALEQNGFAYVRPLTRSAEFPSARDEDLFVVSIADDASSASDMQEFYARILDANIPWLRVIYGAVSGSAEIGPIFLPGTILCVPCLFVPLSRGTTSVDQTRMDRYAWAAVVASEITALLLTRQPFSRAFRRYNLPSLESEIRTWSKAGLCIHHSANCASLHRPHSSVSEHVQFVKQMPLLYEEAIASRHESADITEKKYVSARSYDSTKKMLNSVSISLPRPTLNLSQSVMDLLISDGRKRACVVNLEKITQLLTLSVGLKEIVGDQCRRWAPSGGNLGSTDAYLVARDVIGLDSGVYLYRPDGHNLKKVNQAHTEHVAAAYAAACMEPSVPALLVFSGAYARVARKYGSFAYKLIHLDGGVISSQCLLTASALGLRVNAVAEWNSIGLEKALAIRHYHDVPLQVFCVSGSSQRSDQRQERYNSRCVPIDSLQMNQVPSILTEIRPEEILRKLIDSNECVCNRLPQRLLSWESASLRRLRTFMSAAVRSRMTVGQAFNRRSSQRSFLKRGVALRDVRLLLRSALDNSVFLESRLSVTVLVQQFGSEKSGIYRLTRETMSLEKLREPLEKEQVQQLFYDFDYGDTPLIVWISGPILPEKESEGKRGEYQTLLVRAGLLGHRLWIAALALGLVGTLIAGIRSGATTIADCFVEDGEVSLTAFVCGYASPRTEIEAEQK